MPKLVARVPRPLMPTGVHWEGHGAGDLLKVDESEVPSYLACRGSQSEVQWGLTEYADQPEVTQAHEGLVRATTEVEDLEHQLALARGRAEAQKKLVEQEEAAKVGQVPDVSAAEAAADAKRRADAAALGIALPPVPPAPPAPAAVPAAAESVAAAPAPTTVDATAVPPAGFMPEIDPFSDLYASTEDMAKAMAETIVASQDEPLDLNALNTGDALAEKLSNLSTSVEELAKAEESTTTPEVLEAPEEGSEENASEENPEGENPEEGSEENAEGETPKKPKGKGGRPRKVQPET